MTTALSLSPRSLTSLVLHPVVCLCSVKLIALDGYTFNVRPGSLNHRLQLDNVTHCLGAAGLDAAANPLDLRLRCIKVSRLRDPQDVVGLRDFHRA